MLERLKRRILYSRPFRSLIAWSQRLVLPGFAGFSVYAISRFFLRAIGEGHLITRASAIAFKLFMALFPAIIVLLTLLPFVPIAEFQEKLMGNLEELMPAEVFRFVESTLEDLVVKKHSTLLSVSFLLGLYFASNSVDAILNGFSESSQHDTWHNPLKQRLLSMGLLLALTLMSVVAILLLTVSGSVITWADAHGLLPGDLTVFGLQLARWVISMLLVLGAFSLLYYAGDPMAKRFRFFTPGAILATFLFIIVSQALAYFFSNFTDYNALYGSIGAILAVQLWLYLNMLVLLVGYELNTSISRARRSRSSELRVRRDQGVA